MNKPSSAARKAAIYLRISLDREMDGLAIDRQREGIALAKAKGKYQRSPKLGREEIEQARQLVDQGVPKTRAAAKFGVPRWTLAAALAGKGVYGER